MLTGQRIIRNRDLEPSWSVLRAREAGFMRSLITWMGGPEGYINTNPGVAIESRHCAVGIMDMGAGNRQPGVHRHTIDEIYVILEGTCESFDGVGNTHVAGPFDCLYIPKGVPHGVRTLGEVPLKLLWVNDDIERWGVSVYAEGPGPHPADDEVRLIRFLDLEPSWRSPRAREGGFLRWDVSWVGGGRVGGNCNPGMAIESDRVGLGLTVLQPANRLAESAAQGNQLWVVVGGEAVVAVDGARELLGKQDALFVPAGGELDLRAGGGGPLHLVKVEETRAR